MRHHFPSQGLGVETRGEGAIRWRYVSPSSERHPFYSLYSRTLLAWVPPPGFTLPLNFRNHKAITYEQEAGEEQI
jgi:hypothetical protein